jgi:hypothetical protein
MEPTCPMACAIMSPRGHAAHSARWADETNQPAEVIQIESDMQNP